MEQFQNPAQSPVQETQAAADVTTELTDTLAKWITYYTQLGKKISELEESKKMAHEQLVNAANAAGANVLVYKGKPVATVKTQTTKRLNTKALAEKEPELYERFSYSTESQVLRIKK